MMTKVILVIIVMISCSSNFASAYDEETTHPDITENAAHNSNIESYLIQKLSFADGLNTRLPSDTDKTILYWLRKGSAEEDQPICRSNNHFHNPLRPWDQSYMTDDATTVLGYMARQYCNLAGWPYSGRKSNVIWATSYLSPPPDGTKITISNQQMGWDDVRKYYYNALKTTAVIDRDRYFTLTFQALGQILHLLQDVSVPAHVRNDFTAHLKFHGFENFNPVKWFNNSYEDYVKNHSSLVFNTEPIFSFFTSPRLTDFWDTDLYTGNFDLPDLPFGLAEFTNAKYFSDSTIPNNGPKPEHLFTYPFVASTNARICEDYAAGFTEKRKYISRKDRGECPPLSEERTADHFAAISLLNEEDEISIDNIASLKLELDGNVHHTYAKELLPRAIGYSAGLLDYFFRGELEVTAVPILYRNTILYVRVKVKNITPTQETMKGGHFVLSYRYTPTGGKSDGSEDIFGLAWANYPISPEATNTELKYAVGQANADEKEVDFWLPNPIPWENYNSAKFTLAFKGTLGNEEGAVIGKSLSLGDVKFKEEWDNGLDGNHTWAHTDFNLLDQNPNNGSTSNIIGGESLIKDNIRFVGYKTARVNESFLSTFYNNGQFKNNLPLKITSDTYLQFKIDEMWINQIPPAPPGYTNHWQYLMLRFNNGLGLQLSVGQGVNMGPNVGTFDFDPNLIFVDNIHQLFQKANITIPSGDLYLEEVSFVQQLNLLDDPSEVEHHQHMRIDSIWVVEGKKQ